MAIRYVDYIASVAHVRESDKDLFFQIYFDIVAQGVFYSFFYAFPKSRNHFNDNYKKYIFGQFTMFFTGLKISHKSQFKKDWKFIEDWCLDLGAGNVLKMNQNGNFFCKTKIRSRGQRESRDAASAEQVRAQKTAFETKKR
jgi:hypothetical protein